MNLKKILILLFIITTFLLISDETEDQIITKINKTDIKIGEKIVLLTKIKNLNNVKILWEDITPSDTSADMIEKKDFYKDNYLNIEITFTFFNAGSYYDFFYTVPIKDESGELIYLETKRYNIFVEGVLSSQDKENIKNIKDPSKIELRKEKAQEKIKLNLSFYIKIGIIVLTIIILGLFAYFFIYKNLIKLKPKNNQLIKKLPPYEKFLYDMEHVNFQKNDERVVTEAKLSFLSESLKELITSEFEMNAIAETTKELIINLKQINFDNEITIKIQKIFYEMDMIKFTKAPYEFDEIFNYYNIVKDLGAKINSIYRAKQEENKIEGEKK